MPRCGEPHPVMGNECTLLPGHASKVHQAYIRDALYLWDDTCSWCGHQRHADACPGRAVLQTETRYKNGTIRRPELSVPCRCAWNRLLVQGRGGAVR